MQTRTILPGICFSLILLTVYGTRATALPTINLTATRPTILNNGRDYTEIIADVRDSTGGFVPDGTVVRFETSLGQFRPAMTQSTTTTTQAGQARVQLAGQEKGVAKVFASVPGAVSTAIEVAFTDDASETYPGNAYMSVMGTRSTVYSPLDHLVEASGKLPKEGETGALPGASLTYRNIEILADTLQYNITENAVRAVGNVHVTRAGKHLNCARLYFPLVRGDAYAIMESDRRLIRVQIKTSNLATTPMEQGISTHVFEMVDLSDAVQLISARHIRIFPGEKLQFVRPNFYSDGQKLVSMQFYSLPLNSNRIINEQVLNVGSQGFGMDLPLYYDLSPNSTGIFHVRHGVQSGRNLFSTNPGWSLDMIQDYSSPGTNRRYTGEFGLIGLSQSDWGLRWTHSQEFSQDTRGSFYLDLPQHRSLFASTSLSRQMGPLHLGLNLSGNRSLTSFSSSGTEGDVYLETNPRKVGHTGYTMALGATASAINSQASGFRSNTNTEGVQARFYSSPFRLDRRTSLTNYFTIGDAWTSQGRSGASIISSLSASRTFRGGANLQMTYEFTRQPTVLTDGGSHRLTTNLLMGGSNKWNLMVYHSIVLDANNSSLIGDLNYAIAPRWRLTLSTTVQQYLSTRYRDYAFGIGRNLGGRDFVLSYSTFTHRVYFDLEASRF